MNRQSLVAFFVGVMFALGLGIAGMTQPARVIGFLDLAHWDLTLAFVMAGAIAVHGIAYLLILRRQRPLFAPAFQIPERTAIDRRLIIGAIMFGIGWGLAGYCPGPGIVSLVTGSTSALIFVGSMCVGMLVVRLTKSSST
jgi:uncharacterized protein